MPEAADAHAGDRPDAERIVEVSDARRLTPDTIFLTATTLIAAWLRLRELAIPSFWFDEIVHYDLATKAASQPWWRWLTIFEIENGPLFYGLQLAGRIAHTPEFSARIAPALCGIATVPVLWFAARAMHAHRGISYAAAILIALSPLDVYYSREARPYALVVLIAAALILAVLHEKFALFTALLVVSFYSGAMMAPVIAAAVLATLRKPKWWIAAGGCVVLLAVCYRPGSYPRQFGVPLTKGNVGAVFESFSVIALDVNRPHRGAYVFAALAIAGAIVLLRRNRATALAVIAIGILPVAIGLAATAVLRRPFGVRYVIGGLPGYLLLVAAGIAWISTWFRRADVLAAILIAALLGREGWYSAIEEPFQKLDWRTIAKTIEAHAHEKDAIIAADGWTFVQLRFYLTPRLRLLDAGGSQTMGEVFAYQNTSSWLIVADAGGSSDFSRWACRFPTLLGSSLQQFRLHYCPSSYYFLTDRSTGGEQRALAASFTGLTFGAGDDTILGDGWSGPERDGDGWARWAVGRHAFIAAPPQPIAIDVSSIANQTMTVHLNDAPLAALPLTQQQKIYTLNGTFRGMNIWRLDFERTVVPSTTDRRELAARFHGGGLASHLVRLDEAASYIDENSVWRTRGGRELPPNFDRAKLARLLGGMGFDPDRAIPALTSRRVTLANLASTIADDSACTDDPSFLRTVVRALLGREVSPRELDTFSRQLAQGMTRQEIVWRLANSDEVRARFR